MTTFAARPQSTATGRHPGDFAEASSHPALLATAARMFPAERAS